MLLADIDLDAEFFRLVKLLVAIVQPVLFLILCLGLVVAFIHLLTMLGTTWGNRRVSSKAMIFSFGVHLCLVIGLVALIPEYRRKVWATISSDSEEIRVSVSTVDPHAPDSSIAGQGGLRARLSQPASPIGSTISRTERTTDPFEQESPKVERPEMASVLPEFNGANVTPPPVEVTPDKIAATQSVLEEFAAANLAQPSAAPISPEPEVPRVQPQLARSTPVNAPPKEEVVINRPTRGAVDRVAEAMVASQEPKSLNIPASEEARLTRGQEDDIVRRVGRLPPRRFPTRRPDRRRPAPRTPPPARPLRQSPETPSRRFPNPVSLSSTDPGPWFLQASRDCPHHRPGGLPRN